MMQASVCSSAGGGRLQPLPIGVWLAARRLWQGRFVWPGGGWGAPRLLTRGRLVALVLALPRRRVVKSTPHALPIKKRRELLKTLKGEGFLELQRPMDTVA